jgi:hypothetical protein
MFVDIVYDFGELYRSSSMIFLVYLCVFGIIDVDDTFYDCIKEAAVAG